MPITGEMMPSGSCWHKSW